MSLIGVVGVDVDSSLDSLAVSESATWSGARFVSVGLAILAMSGAGLLAFRPKDSVE